MKVQFICNFSRSKSIYIEIVSGIATQWWVKMQFNWTDISLINTSDGKLHGKTQSVSDIFKHLFSHKIYFDLQR